MEVLYFLPLHKALFIQIKLWKSSTNRILLNFHWCIDVCRTSFNKNNIILSLLKLHIYIYYCLTKRLMIQPNTPWYFCWDASNHFSTINIELEAFQDLNIFYLFIIKVKCHRLFKFLNWKGLLLPVLTMCEKLKYG